MVSSWTTASISSPALRLRCRLPSRGTSPDAAWATLAAAGPRVSAALVLEAAAAGGVDILLARGGVFLNDPLLLDAGPRAAGANFTGGVRVAAFGNASLPRPLLQHARGLASLGATPCVSLQAQPSYSVQPSSSGPRVSLQAQSSYSGQLSSSSP